MIGLLDGLKIAAGGVAGAALMFVAASAYTTFVVAPAIEKTTRTIVEAEAERRTFDAIKTVSDAAERARAMRRYCAGRGQLYDFAANQCRE